MDVTGAVTVTVGWCMGHRLPNHEGRCYNLHGHQYTAEASVLGPISQDKGSPSEGMVVDFTAVKDRLKFLVDRLDHRMLIYRGDPLAESMKLLPGVNIVDYVPTAENIAQRLLEAMADQNVSSIRVWETPTSFATVWRDK